MKKKLSLKFLIILLFMFAISNLFFLSNTDASVGNNFKKMNAKYHMKQIRINQVVNLDPYLLNLNMWHSGIKAYKFMYKGIKYIALFNYNNICWEEFALGYGFSMSPLKTLIGKKLYKYSPVRIVSYTPLQYEKLIYGKGVGKVTYVIEYFYNGYISEAKMPSMSPNGNKSVLQ